MERAERDTGHTQMLVQEPAGSQSLVARSGVHVFQRLPKAPGNRKVTPVTARLPSAFRTGVHDHDLGPLRLCFGEIDEVLIAPVRHFIQHRQQ